MEVLPPSRLCAKTRTLANLLKTVAVVIMDVYTKKTVNIYNHKSWKETKQGENEQVMQIKAIVIRLIWDELKNLQKMQKIARFEEMLPEINETLKTNALVDHNNTIARRVLEALTKDDNKFRMLTIIDDFLQEVKGEQANAYHLRFAEEKDVCDAILNYVNTNDTVTSESYVKGLLYHTHMAFYDIGREHAWGDRSDVKLAGEYNSVILNGGNPMSKSTLTTIQDTFKDIKKERRGKWVIQDASGEDVELKKNSKACPLPIVLYVMVTQFANILMDISNSSLTSMLKTENWTNVLLLFSFLMHEGARPGDTIGWETTGKNKKNMTNRGQQHNNLMFSLNGKQYPVFVLVFVKPQTLAYLLEGHLQRYVCSFFKGKQAGKYKSGEYRARVKSWIPREYNILDLATMYIILMRIKVAIAPENVTMHIFKKGQKISEHVKDSTEPRTHPRYFSANIRGLTAYSIRYAAAEEEHECYVARSWTQYRMGHSVNSQMCEMYGENFEQRVELLCEEDFDVKLGSDVQASLDDTTIPRFFLPHTQGSELPDNKIADLNADILSELDMINTLVKPLLDGTSTLQEIPDLIVLAPKNRTDLLSELQMIPLGSHFEFLEGLLPEKMQKDMSERLAYIHEHFAPVDPPAHRLKIWAFPQIMWGEFNENLKEEVRDNRIIRLGNQLENMVSKLHTQLGNKSRLVVPELKKIKKRKMMKTRTKATSSVPSATPTPMKRKVKLTNKAHEEVKVKKGVNAWEGRVVAIICPRPGEAPEYEHAIAGSEHKVWIGLALKLFGSTTKAGRVHAKWYKKTATGLRLAKELSEAHFCSRGLVKWWPADCSTRETFSIPDADIAKMAEHLNTHFAKA